MTATIGSQFAKKVRPHADIGSGVVEVRDLISIGDAGSAGAWSATLSPELPSVRQRLTIGDLIPRVPVPAGVSRIAYVRELSPHTSDGGASAVAEGSAKPEVEMSFEGGELPVQKIAAWVPATVEILEDAPAVGAYVDGRLRYLLKIREEAELLDGDGTGENLLGIRQTPGVQTQAFATSVNETIARSIEKVELVDGRVTGVVIHPSSYRVGYLADPTFWAGLGVAVVRSRAVGTAKALVGNFANAAQIHERQLSVTLSNSHADYFVKNKVVIRAELREALRTHAPAEFVDATLA